MIRFVLVSLLALAACSSSEDQAPPAGNTAAPVPTVPVAAAPSNATEPADPATADAHAKPAPGTLQTFKDWTVGCDNTRRCTMAALAPEGGDFPAVTMNLMRDAGPDGAIGIELDSRDEAAPGPTAIAIDGRRFDVTTPDGLSGDPARKIATAMANGKALTVLAGKTKAGTLSLAGVSAALRFIDEQQGRADGETALVAKGSKPASDVPPAPAAPIVVAHPMTATTLDAIYVSSLRRLAGCADDEMSMKQDVQAFAIGDGKTLALVPCSVGAYNVFASLFIVDGGKAAPATTDAPGNLSNTPDSDTPQAVNAVLDGGLLKSYAKGRGLGDCGIYQTLAWDGATIRLVEQSEMGECRGNPNYITTWRTQVVRR